MSGIIIISKPGKPGSEASVATGRRSSRNLLPLVLAAFCDKGNEKAHLVHEVAQDRTDCSMLFDHSLKTGFRCDDRSRSLQASDGSIEAKNQTARKSLRPPVNLRRPCQAILYWGWWFQLGQERTRYVHIQSHTNNAQERRLLHATVGRCVRLESLDAMVSRPHRDNLCTNYKRQQ